MRRNISQKISCFADICHRMAHCHEHIDNSGDIVLVGKQRVCDRARNRAYRRRLQYIIDTPTCIAAVFQISNIAIDKSEVSPLIRSNQRFHRNRSTPSRLPPAGGGRSTITFYLLQIVAIPRGKIIEPHDLLIQFQQRFQQIGTDKAGHTGYQPGTGVADCQVVESVIDDPI